MPPAIERLPPSEAKLLQHSVGPFLGHRLAVVADSLVIAEGGVGRRVVEVYWGNFRLTLRRVRWRWRRGLLCPSQGADQFKLLLGRGRFEDFPELGHFLGVLALQLEKLDLRLEAGVLCLQLLPLRFGLLVLGQTCHPKFLGLALGLLQGCLFLVQRALEALCAFLELLRQLLLDLFKTLLDVIDRGYGRGFR